MKLFALDSPLMMGMRKLADVIICNMIFLLCCIPVFTAGASLAALYQAMEILIADTDNGLLFLDFFKAFRKHFKRATLMWLLCLLIGCVLYLYYRAVGTMGGSLQKVYTITLYAILFLILFMYQYLFPMIVYRTGNIRQTLKNAITVSVASFQYTILSILLLVVSVVLSWMVYYQNGYGVIYLWLICGFGIICYMNSMLFNKAASRIGMESDNPDIAAPEDIDISQF